MPFCFGGAGQVLLPLTAGWLKDATTILTWSSYQVHIQSQRRYFMAHDLIYINQTICWLFECKLFCFAYWPQGQQSHNGDARTLLACIHSDSTIGCSLSVFRSASFGNLLSSNNNNVLRKLSGTLNYPLIPKFKLCKAKEAENQCTFKVIRDHKWSKSVLL